MRHDCPSPRTRIFYPHPLQAKFYFERLKQNALMSNAQSADCRVGFKVEDEQNAIFRRLRV